MKYLAAACAAIGLALVAAPAVAGSPPPSTRPP